MSRVKPSRTRLAPNALWTLTSLITAYKCDAPDHKKRRGGFGPPLHVRSSRYAAKLPSARPLEGAIAQLANALARNAEHRPDLFERVLTSALETEIETQHLRVARRERVERLLDLIGEEAVHGLFLGVRHLVGHEALDERA